MTRRIGLALTLDVGDSEDVDCTVRGTAVPQHRGSRTEPGSGPSVEDYAVIRDSDGVDVTALLIGAQVYRVAEAIIEAAQNADEDARESWADCSGDD